tara:strand:- start:1830 stop:2480 length:651 start_codon:yes stop_codon:yes gene_type:complete
MEKYGFVYIWRDAKHRRYYVGAHWGTEEDGYVCSSAWMMKAYKKRSNDFKRKILETGLTSKKETFKTEDKWLRLIKEEELKNKYYNVHNKGRDYWFTDAAKAEIVKSKISKSKMGVPIHSDEYKEQLRQNALGNNGNFGGGDHPKLGTHHSTETLEKLSKAAKKRMKGASGPVVSEEGRKSTGRKNSSHMKQKWQDPKYREMILAKRKEAAIIKGI